ncbi:hypothetical protein [Streptococcus loxodontisalivarius]|uniref:Uncharacterized protein n=1 Tax=Streptococcus loxodontisalivarius TaxID=1349415 RepID=A0ABS2PQ19_9STRE|nr:hypothetical protein [Streptococcus loxodontisalivarius]MBM7642129.1 hypothetical protein [Streptococcus loxodontisalivarius]
MSYTVKISDIQGADSSSSSTFDLSSFEGKSLSFEMQYNVKDTQAEFSTDLSDINDKVSKVDFIYDDDKAYVNADALFAYYGFDTTTVKGKYVDLAEISDNEIPALSDYESMEADYSWLEDIDEDSFTEKDGQVTATIKMSDLIEQVAKQADDDTSETYLNIAKASLSDKSTAKITLDEDGSGEIKMTIAFADGIDYGFDSMTLEISFKKIDYKKPSIPTASNILSKSQLESAMESSYRLDDTTFQGIYDVVKDNLKTVDQATLKEYVSEYSDYMTDEQKAKINALIAQASAA